MREGDEGRGQEEKEKEGDDRQGQRIEPKEY